MKRKSDYWLKRRDSLFEMESRMTINTLAPFYKDLYNSTYSSLLTLLDEIDTNKEAGGIVLVSDIYKADRYYQMLSQFNKDNILMGSKEITTIHKSLTDMYKSNSELVRDEIGKDKSFSITNIDAIEKTVNAVWCQDGKNWSDRIWQNKEVMQETLRKGIVDIIAKGQERTQLINQLQQFTKQEINRAYNKAARIVNTELAYVMVQSTLDKYKEAGIEYYKILAMNGACSDCAEEYNGMVFRIDEAEVGKNCPPFHPNCRCTTLAVFNKGDKI